MDLGHHDRISVGVLFAGIDPLRICAVLGVAIDQAVLRRVEQPVAPDASDRGHFLAADGKDPILPGTAIDFGGELFVRSRSIPLILGIQGEEVIVRALDDVVKIAELYLDSARFVFCPRAARTFFVPDAAIERFTAIDRPRLKRDHAVIALIADDQSGAGMDQDIILFVADDDRRI